MDRRTIRIVPYRDYGDARQGRSGPRRPDVCAHGRRRRKFSYRTKSRAARKTFQRDGRTLLEAAGTFPAARRNFVFRSGDYGARHQAAVEYADCFSDPHCAAFRRVALAAEVGSGMKAREKTARKIAAMAAIVCAAFSARSAK